MAPSAWFCSKATHKKLVLPSTAGGVKRSARLYFAHCASVRRVIEKSFTAFFVLFLLRSWELPVKPIAPSHVLTHKSQVMNTNSLLHKCGFFTPAFIPFWSLRVKKLEKRPKLSWLFLYAWLEWKIWSMNKQKMQNGLTHAKLSASKDRRKKTTKKNKPQLSGSYHFFSHCYKSSLGIFYPFSLFWSWSVPKPASSCDLNQPGEDQHVFLSRRTKPAAYCCHPPQSHAPAHRCSSLVPSVSVIDRPSMPLPPAGDGKKNIFLKRMTLVMMIFG